MDGVLGGLALGLAIGVRHAFEPDHLTAVTTLVTDAPDARRGAWLGALWGIGHTLSLLAVAIALLAIGAALPPGLTTAFELGVAAMLIGLGIRAVVRARKGDPPTRHRHGATEHVHAGGERHVHVAGRALAWRPLVVGTIHGLAGSGALTALVFAQLASTPARVAYIAVFGLGSMIAMAATSAIAGASLHAVAAGPRARRAIGYAAGALSIAVGIAWLGAGA
jgi:hypothetical protein